MWPSTLCPFTSSTRNMALGSGSVTTPSISIASSLGVALATARASFFARASAEDRRLGPPLRCAIRSSIAWSPAGGQGAASRAATRRGVTLGEIAHQGRRQLACMAYGKIVARRLPVPAPDVWKRLFQDVADLAKVYGTATGRHDQRRHVERSQLLARRTKGHETPALFSQGGRHRAQGVPRALIAPSPRSLTRHGVAEA